MEIATGADPLTATIGYVPGVGALDAPTCDVCEDSLSEDDPATDLRAGGITGAGCKKELYNRFLVSRDLLAY